MSNTIYNFQDRWYVIPKGFAIYRLKTIGLDEDSRSREVFFYVFVRFTFFPLSESHIPQCGLLEAPLLFTISWSHEEASVRGRRVSQWIQQGLLPGSTEPSLQSHRSGALTNVGWQYAWAKDAEVQRHHAYCPILTQFSSSLHGALVKWTARDHQTNVSLYLLSLNLILLTSSYLKNWRKKKEKEKQTA